MCSFINFTNLVISLVTCTGIGLIALFPGIHYALILMVLGPWLIKTFGAGPGLLGMAWSVVIARSCHSLSVVYHPVAADQIASAEPAQRLALKGQGQWATTVMGESLWLAVILVAVLMGFNSLVFWITGQQLNIFVNALKNSSWLTWPISVGWIGFVVSKAKRKKSTMLVLISSGLLGAVALLHPSIRGSSHAMTPLLLGLFSVPVLITTLRQNHGKNLRELGQDLELSQDPEKDPGEELKWLAIVIGLASVLLPGIGTSSLVSMGQGMTQSDSDYLALASLSEGFGEILAMVTGILGIANRSADASVINRILLTNNNIGPQLSNSFIYILLITLVCGTWLGLTLVHYIGPAYRYLVEIIPQKFQAMVILACVLVIVWVTSGYWGLGIVLVGTLIHLGAKQLSCPNQAMFSCLLVPMGLETLGIV